MTKSMNDCDLRVSRLISMMENACTAFCTHNAVKTAYKHRNIFNWREMTHNFRQNRRIIAICVCLSFFRRWRTRALSSARTMQ